VTPSVAAPDDTNLSDATDEPVLVQIHSGFFLRWLGEKRDTTKSHGEVIFHLLAVNSSLNQIQPKLAPKY